MHIILKVHKYNSPMTLGYCFALCLSLRIHVGTSSLFKLILLSDKLLKMLIKSIKL